MIEIGTLIRERRRKLKLTHAAAAKIIGIPGKTLESKRSFLCQIENGQRMVPQEIPPGLPEFLGMDKSAIEKLISDQKRPRWINSGLDSAITIADIDFVRNSCEALGGQITLENLLRLLEISTSNKKQKFPE